MDRALNPVLRGKYNYYLKAIKAVKIGEETYKSKGKYVTVEWIQMSTRI